MSFRASFIESCTAQAKLLGRKLTFGEVCDIAEVTHKGAVRERKRGAILPEAEQVYELFPKKVGREDALRAITNALKKHDLAYLLDKTNQFRECVESWPSSYRYFQDGGDRCPHPASFYNAGRYADDPREWKRHGARTSAPNARISPSEPQGWQDAFPDFVDRDKPWHMLQPAQQAYIISTLNGKQFTAIPEQVANEQALRHA